MGPVALAAANATMEPSVTSLAVNACAPRVSWERSVLIDALRADSAQIATRLVHAKMEVYVIRKTAFADVRQGSMERTASCAVVSMPICTRHHSVTRSAIAI